MADRLNDTQAAELQRMIDKINALDDRDRCRINGYIEQLLESPKYFKRNLTLIKGGEYHNSSSGIPGAKNNS